MKIVKGWVVVLLALASGGMLSWTVSARFGPHAWYVFLCSTIFALAIVKLINRRSREKEIQEMAKHDWDTYAKDLIKKMGRGNEGREDGPFNKTSLERARLINLRDALAWGNRGFYLESPGRHQEAIGRLKKY